MADENKVEETVVKEQEIARGDRGTVGQATTALTLKQMWHEATHNLVEVGDKHNPHRQAWVKQRGALSLKRWVKSLEKSHPSFALAKEWIANKNDAKNQKRSDKNIKRIFEEKQASKASRRKKSQASQNKKTADATPAAK